MPNEQPVQNGTPPDLPMVPLGAVIQAVEDLMQPEEGDAAMRFLARGWNGQIDIIVDELKRRFGK